MGNLWSFQQQNSKVRYKVVLPTYCRAWEQLYNGNVETWDAVAAEYGMDKYAYNCGLPNCDRETVCLKYVRATLKSDHQSITIDRYKASTVHVPIGGCSEVQRLLGVGFRLNEVVAAQRHKLLLLVLHDARDFITQANFLLVYLGDNDHAAVSKGKKDGASLHSSYRVLKRLSSREGKLEDRRKMSGSSIDGRSTESKRNVSASSTSSSKSGGGWSDGETGATCISAPENKGPRCLGVLQAPQKDMTIISCHISPDLTQTAIMFYSMSRLFGTFCYTLHCYSNLSLQSQTLSNSKRANQFNSKVDDGEVVSQMSPPVEKSPMQEAACPHLVQTVKLSREVQPYFVYDPRYGNSRISVANYECKESGIAHELVVLQLHTNIGDKPTRSWDREDTKQEAGPTGKKDVSEALVRVVKRGKLSLPALFGNSRFNLLYSKDGELVILQKLTDDRFGVTSFCDIYIFHSDDLTLIKYMTSALPGLFHICKVSYEPVFSRCGSFMRLIDHRINTTTNANSHRGGAGGRGGGDGDEGEEYAAVHIYQLPRSLRLLSQCRRVILQNLSPSKSPDLLPLPKRLKDYLDFGPLY